MQSICKKKQQVKRTCIQYNGRRAQGLSLEDVEKRQQWAKNKKKEKEAKEQARRAKRDKQYLAKISKNLMRLRPDMFRGAISTQKAFNIRPSLISHVGPNSRRPRNTKSDNQDFALVSQDLIWLGPNLFWQLDTDERVLNTSVRNKEKIVQRRNNTPMQL